MKPISIIKLKTKRQFANICRKAAKIIEKQQLLPRGTSVQNGCHCMGSAMGVSVYTDDSGYIFGMFSEFRRTIERPNVRKLLGKMHHVFETLHQWNDHKAKSPKHAAARLRYLARSLEHGGATWWNYDE